MNRYYQKSPCFYNKFLKYKIIPLFLNNALIIVCHLKQVCVQFPMSLKLKCLNIISKTSGGKFSMVIQTDIFDEIL